MKTEKQIIGFETREHHVDLCVVGGGLAGITAAVSAARRGLKVVLMHDRPVLGGNASSEVRMCIRGAHGDDMQETGIIEEIALENIYRNPNLNFYIWDSVLFGLVKAEENITLELNCSCMDAEMEGDKIVSVTGWQTTTQTWQKVYATIVADCSGDSVLAPLTGAEWRMGREARSEFDEDIAPEVSDECTMGMSCLIQVRETTEPVTFIPPKWANTYTKDDFPHRMDLSPDKWMESNFWWLEIGGVYDTIKDTEVLRDELIKIAYGVWDFIKNSGELHTDNWDLEWMGFLPGKRESRRYVGDHILTQHDIRNQTLFEDMIAYGGWSMDDHHPKGFETKEVPTIYHAAPSPYGIPYRCIYSKNIKNLMFAGRNISATHSANSSARVMATCGLLGQALGTAASIAVEYGLTPRGVYEEKVALLKQALQEDDCYLPWHKWEPSVIMNHAIITTSEGENAHLLDGLERTVDGVDHAWVGTTDSEVIVQLENVQYVNELQLIFDSDINRSTWKEQSGMLKRYPMKCHVYLNEKKVVVPKTITKAYELWIDEGDGIWKLFNEEENNYQRLVTIPIHKTIEKVKFIPKATWGSEEVRIYRLALK